MTEPQVTHEEIETAFSIALACDHCVDVDHTCWDCTVKMFNHDEDQMIRAEAAEAERNTAQRQVKRLTADVKYWKNIAMKYAPDSELFEDKR